MSIEKDIKQKKFKNPYNKLTINLMYTDGWLFSQYAKVLKPHNLTERQFLVLKIIRDNYPLAVTVNHIIEYMIEETSNVSRLVDKLILKNLVIKTKSNFDLRSVNIQLTEKGLLLMDELIIMIEDWEKSFFSIDESELQMLENLLNRLREK